MMEQRSQEWYAARCGSLGASVLHEVVARTKSGWGASRANRMAAIIIERLTGVPQDTYVTAAMQWGIDTEPEGKAFYCFMSDYELVDIGLVCHPRVVGTHASPDGLIGDDGLLELKCPQPAQHLEYLLEETVPNKYVIQAQWQMACTGRKWCDFASYSPAFPPSMRLYRERIERDDAHIAELEGHVREFLSEVDAKLKALTNRYGDVREAA